MHPIDPSQAAASAGAAAPATGARGGGVERVSPLARPSYRPRTSCLPVCLLVMVVFTLIYAFAFLLAPALRVRGFPSTTCSLISASRKCNGYRPIGWFYVDVPCWNIVVTYKELGSGAPNGVRTTVPLLDKIPPSADGCESFKDCGNITLNGRYNPAKKQEVYVEWTFPKEYIATAFLLPALLFSCFCASCVYARRGGKRVQRNATIRPLEEVVTSGPEDSFGTPEVLQVYGSSSSASVSKHVEKGGKLSDYGPAVPSAPPLDEESLGYGSSLSTRNSHGKYAAPAR